MKNKHPLENHPNDLHNNPIKRYNPQSSTNVTSSSLTFIKTPKKTHEIDLRQQGPEQQIYDFGTRYRLLEQKYSNLWEETRVRRELFRKQKEQLQRYRELDDLNQKQIRQLRDRIDQERRNQAYNHNFLEQSWCRSGVKERISSPSVPKERRSPADLTKLEIPSSSSCTLLTPLKKNSRIRLQTASKPQFSRYKFVPTLPLQ